MLVRTKRKYNEVFKENLTSSKKKTMDLQFSFTNPTHENELRKQAMLKKHGASAKSVKVLGSRENQLPTSKKQPSITKYYSSKPKKTGQVKIFEENVNSEHQNDKKSTKEAETSVFSMLCDKEAPKKYWEMVAEERRKALALALDENKQLAEEIGEKDKTIHELEEEVAELKETADHAEYLASAIAEIAKDVGLDIDLSGKEEESNSDGIDSILAEELDESVSEDADEQSENDNEEESHESDGEDEVSINDEKIDIEKQDSPKIKLVDEPTFVKDDAKASKDKLDEKDNNEGKPCCSSSTA